MDNWARSFNSYFKDLSQLLRLISDKATPKDLEKLAKMPGFIEWSNQVAGRMAVNAYRQNARSWRDAAAKSGRGRLIYQNLQKQLEGTNVGAAVQSIVQGNAELISSLPLSLAERLTVYVNKRRLEGARAKQIKSEVAAWLPRLAESRIALICRTQVSASETALTKARSEDLVYQVISGPQAKTREYERVTETWRALSFFGTNRQILKCSSERRHTVPTITAGARSIVDVLP